MILAVLVAEAPPGLALPARSLATIRNRVAVRFVSVVAIDVNALLATGVHVAPPSTLRRTEYAASPVPESRAGVQRTVTGMAAPDSVPPDRRVTVGSPGGVGAVVSGPKATTNPSA